jgi:hypothetical protein
MIGKLLEDHGRGAAFGGRALRRRRGLATQRRPPAEHEEGRGRSPADRQDPDEPGHPPGRLVVGGRGPVPPAPETPDRPGQHPARRDQPDGEDDRRHQADVLLPPRIPQLHLEDDQEGLLEEVGVEDAHAEGGGDRGHLEPARRGLALGRGEVGVLRVDLVPRGARLSHRAAAQQYGEFAQRAGGPAVGLRRRRAELPEVVVEAAQHLGGVSGRLDEQGHLAVVELGRRVKRDPLAVDDLLVQPAGTAVVAGREDRVWGHERGQLAVRVVDDLPVEDLVIVVGHVSLLAGSARAGPGPCTTRSAPGSG